MTCNDFYIFHIQCWLAIVWLPWQWVYICYLKCKYSFKLCWYQLGGGEWEWGSVSGGEWELGSVSGRESGRKWGRVTVRAREWGSESGREKEKSSQNPIRGSHKMWVHETGLIPLHFMCLSLTMFLWGLILFHFLCLGWTTQVCHAILWHDSNTSHIYITVVPSCMCMYALKWAV